MEEEKLSLALPVIVEGKFDREKLLNVLDARIFTTDGFGLFNSAEKKALFRALAEKSPLLILTDSDGAGLVIRNYFNSILPKEKLIHLYTPQIPGKEKRKKEPSKAGFLGVEGMEKELLLSLFRPFASGDLPEKREEITKTDFFADGLSGGKDSALKRDALAGKIGLPAGMSANALLGAVNLLLTKEEYEKCCHS